MKYLTCAFVAILLAIPSVHAQRDYYGPERLPRFSRPYGYDRQYRGPMTDPGVYSDEQRRFNRERREYERFRSYQRGPYNPY